MLLTGPRGSGKTVTLNALEDLARAHRWEVISETMRPGLARDLTTSMLPDLLRRIDPDARSSRMTSMQGSALGFGAGASREVEDRYPRPEPSLRSLVTAATEVLDQRGTGLLLSLDEVHTAAVADLREIAQVVQHAFREGRPLAFVGAGLPSSVEDVLNDEVLTFLRRAERFALADVDPDEVAIALQQPIEAAGRSTAPKHWTSPSTEHAATPSSCSSSEDTCGMPTPNVRRSASRTPTRASSRPGAGLAVSYISLRCPAFPTSTETSLPRWRSTMHRAACGTSLDGWTSTRHTRANTASG